MRTEKEIQLLDELNSIQKEKNEVCRKSSWSAVATIVGATWGLILKDDISGPAVNNIICNIILLLLLASAVVFFSLEGWRTSRESQSARNLHEQICKGNDIDDIEVVAQINKVSDWSYRVFRHELLLCGFMMLLLFVFTLIRML